MGDFSGTHKGVSPVDWISPKYQQERKHTMKIGISVPEVVELFNEIRKAHGRLLETMRLDIREMAGAYPASFMKQN